MSNISNLFLDKQRFIDENQVDKSVEDLCVEQRQKKNRNELIYVLKAFLLMSS